MKWLALLKQDAMKIEALMFYARFDMLEDFQGLVEGESIRQEGLPPSRPQTPPAASAPPLPQALRV